MRSCKDCKNVKLCKVHYIMVRAIYKNEEFHELMYQGSVNKMFPWLSIPDIQINLAFKLSDCLAAVCNLFEG